MPEGKEFYSIAEVAKLVNYSERSVRQMCIDGKIKAEKIKDARKWLIPASELERLKADSKFTREAKQELYEETAHKQKMRELARRLVEIRIPSALDSFRVWGVKPATYSMLCDDDVLFVIEAENREIAAFADLDGLESTDHETAEANYTWKALFAHLKTGGFMGVVNMIKPFRQKMYAHFEGCYEFVELVKRRIEDETGLSVPSNYSEGFGFTPFFTILICVDAVQNYDGLSFIKDSSYRIEERGNDWALTCDGLVIFIGDSKETLSNYEKMHKDLRLKRIDADKAEKVKAVIEIRKGLENTVSEVRKGLLTFAGKDTLPGHCELCS